VCEEARGAAGWDGCVWERIERAASLPGIRRRWHCLKQGQSDTVIIPKTRRPPLVDEALDARGSANPPAFSSPRCTRRVLPPAFMCARARTVVRPSLVLAVATARGSSSLRTRQAVTGARAAA